MKRTKHDTIYMAVTPDRYELPVFWDTSLGAFAEKVGAPKTTVLASIAHDRSGTTRGYKLVRIYLEDLENE